MAGPFTMSLPSELTTEEALLKWVIVAMIGLAIQRFARRCNYRRCRSVRTINIVQHCTPRNKPGGRLILKLRGQFCFHCRRWWFQQDPEARTFVEKKLRYRLIGWLKLPRKRRLPALHAPVLRPLLLHEIVEQEDLGTLH